jgi:hypothetical protein
MRIVQIVLLVLFCACVNAVSINVAGEGALATEALRLSDMTVVRPGQHPDTISFYLSDGKVMMVSQLYPIAEKGCDWTKMTRTLEAREGEYCLGLDESTYTFKLDRIANGTVDIGSVQDTELPSPFTGMAVAEHEKTAVSNVQEIPVVDKANEEHSVIGLDVGLGITMILALLAAAWVIRSWWHP